jgi:hypothetical protein
MTGLERIELPVGVVDAAGVRHRAVLLRLATARDEIRALADFRVHLRPESLLEILLARCAQVPGGPGPLGAGLVAGLDPRDRECLESAYRRLNGYPALAGRQEATA